MLFYVGCLRYDNYLCSSHVCLKDYGDEAPFTLLLRFSSFSISRLILQLKSTAERSIIVIQ